MQQTVRRDVNEQIIIGTVIGNVLRNDRRVSFEVETVEIINGKKFTKLHTVFTSDPSLIIHINGLQKGSRVYIKGATTPSGSVCIKNFIPFNLL